MNETRSGGGDMNGEDMKKSFVLYKSHWEILEELPLESFKKVMQAAWSLVGACDMPDLDLLERTAFKPIRNDILNNANKWEEKRKKYAEAGRKGGLAKAENAKAKSSDASDAKNAKAKSSDSTLYVDVDVDADVDVDVDADVVNNKTLCASGDALCDDKVKKMEPTKAQIDNHFDELWNLYPKKLNKASVSATTRRKLFKISVDEMERAVNRYISDCENERFNRALVDGNKWFDKRYLDYLDDAYVKNRTSSDDYIRKLCEQSMVDYKEGAE